MHRRFDYAVTILLLLIAALPALAQVGNARPAAPSDSIVMDHTLGISFLRIGEAARQNANGYRMFLESSSGNIIH